MIRRRGVPQMRADACGAKRVRETHESFAKILSNASKTIREKKKKKRCLHAPRDATFIRERKMMRRKLT